MGEANIPPLPEYVRERASGFVGRQWVLDEVSQWLDSQSERYLMILGEPGSGKTALAAWLARAIPDARETSSVKDPAALERLATVRAGWDAVHFCIARGQRGTVNPVHFAQSISTQLAQRHDAFAIAAMERLAPGVNIHMEARENWGTMIGLRLGRLIISERDAEDVYNRVIREPLQELAMSEPDMPVRILVDALDEGYTVAEPNIVTLIAGSGDFPPNVRFLVTSRPEHRVADQFDDLRKLDLSAAKYATASEADLRSYVSSRLLGPEWPVPLPAAEVDDFHGKLVARADGNFLYAKFVLDEMAAGRRSIDDVGSLPDGLYGLYRTFLDRLVPQARERFAEEWTKKHAPFLGCLMVSTPAAPDEILPKWLKWTKSELNVHAESSSQLIEHVADIPNGLDGYRLYHSSIADFLTTDRYHANGERRVNRYYIELADQHRRIASYYMRKIGGEWRGKWSESDSYGLLHLPTHLLGADDSESLLVVLKAPFLVAKVERLTSYAAILEDMLVGIQAAERQSDFAALFRLAVSFVGIKQRVESLPTDIIKQLVSVYVASGRVAQAVDLARLIDKGWLRGITMRAIVTALADIDLREAAQVANRIDDNPLVRAESLEIILNVLVREGPAQSVIYDSATQLLDLVNRITPSSDWEVSWHCGILGRIAIQLQAIDQGLATSLLEQAIAEARTIERDQWRYEDLRRLAAMRFVSNKQEAFRLYDEGLAALETLSDRGWAGTEIGEMLGEVAAKDVEYAIQMALSVSDVVGRSYALAHVARRLAESDTTGARALIQLAIDSSREIGYLPKSEAWGWQASARAKIAWALASLDFDEGISFATEALPGSGADDAFAAIAADPVHSLDRARWVAAQIHSYRRSEALAALARRRAAVDADDADEVLAILADASDREVCCRALAEIAPVLADRGDPGVNSVIDKAELLAAGHPDHAALLLAEVGARIASHYPARAAALRERALAAIPALTRSGDRLGTYASVARQLIAAHDPNGAVDLIRHALRSEFDVREQGWVGEAQVLLLSELARHDPAQALAQASPLPGYVGALALARLVEVAAETDRAEASVLLVKFNQALAGAVGPADDRNWESKLARAGVKARGALVLAAARAASPDTLNLAESLWNEPGYFSALKCRVLAKASGILAARDLAGAEHLLRIVLSEERDDPREVGRALALMAKQDPRAAGRLAAEFVTAYTGRIVGRTDEDICALCEELADTAPDKALELSLQANTATRWPDSTRGYRSKVISRAAAALSRNDRSRAEQLIQEVIDGARHTQPAWLEVEALLQAADALLSWNPVKAERTVADALDRAAHLRFNAIPRYIARAAAVAARGGRDDEAIRLMGEALDELQAHPDTDSFEEITSILSGFPQPIVAGLVPKLLQATLKGSDLLLVRLTLVIPLLISADPRGPANTIRALLSELGTALDLSEKVFIG